MGSEPESPFCLSAANQYTPLCFRSRSFFASDAVPKPRACPVGPPPGAKEPRFFPFRSDLSETPPSTPLRRPNQLRIPAGHVRFYGSGTNSERDRGNGNWRHTGSPPGKQNGNPSSRRFGGSCSGSQAGWLNFRYYVYGGKNRLVYDFCKEFGQRQARQVAHASQ